MSLQWADFPSGQKGLYNTTEAFMLTGTPWVDLGGSGNLVADPDGSGGVVFNQHGINNANSRLALTTPHAKAGVAFRLWISSNDGTTRPIVGFMNTSAGLLYSLALRPNGGLSIHRNVSGSTVLATADYPVVFAGSYNHFEFVANTVTGVIEVRVNGTPVPELTFTDGAPVGGTIGMVALMSAFAGQNSANNFFIKDLVVYNGAGSVFNTFQGSVFVNDSVENSDDTLGGWTTSSGTDGYPLIADTSLRNILSCAGTVSNLDTIRINTTYYKFTSGSVDTGVPAGTSANPWLVALAVDIPTNILNLYKAIGATGTPGVTYSTGLVAHTTATPLGYDLGSLTVAPSDGTTVSMTFAETSANFSWLSLTAFSYGPIDDTYIEADDSPPAPAQFTITDLDPDVTSVKAVMSVVRAYKTDGGDGTLQVNLTPNGVDYDNGADRAVTTVPTFYWDISELSPDTGVAWTPAEVNSALIEFDRTT